MSTSLLRDEKDDVRGTILIFQDITTMMQMAERIRRQERLATVGSLAAGIAHEIRNPLASLSGSIQVLQGELDLKGDNRHLMDIVVRETDRLNTIITDFLEYARPKTTQDDRIVISSVLEETIILLKNSKEFVDGVSISCNVDPAITTRGDARRMRQVFWNLLINSCQAMPNGGEMMISAYPFSHGEEDSAWCEIVIADTGQGISPEHLAKIFDPFFTTKIGGTGLGLAIAYRIIEDHGGTIAVESEEGRGTKFRMLIPMIEDPSRLEIVNARITQRIVP
jgi:two-component system sensor histidine kinase PilS (NtrC family)